MRNQAEKRKKIAERVHAHRQRKKNNIRNEQNIYKSSF